MQQWEATAADLGHPEVRYEEVKNPTLAGWLGALPGVGGFYVGRGGIGTAGLLLWPVSIAWEPWLAHNGAHQYNFMAFRDRMVDVILVELSEEEDRLESRAVRGDVPEVVFMLERERLRRHQKEAEAERGWRHAQRAPESLNGHLERLSNEPKADVGSGVTR